MNTKLLFILFFIVSCGNGHLFKALDSSGSSERLYGGAEVNFAWPDSRYEFSLDFIQGVSVGSNSSFYLKFWDAYQEKKEDYLLLQDKLCVFLWMKMPSGAEHGSSPVILKKERDSYLVDDVYFIMPGEWQVHIRTILDTTSCTKNSPYLKEKIVKVSI